MDEHSDDSIFVIISNSVFSNVCHGDRLPRLESQLHSSYVLYQAARLKFHFLMWNMGVVITLALWDCYRN